MYSTLNLTDNHLVCILEAEDVENFYGALEGVDDLANTLEVNVSVPVE